VNFLEKLGNVISNPYIFAVLTFLQCILIIKLIPYIPVDWESYMDQVELYISGVRDYSQIRGPNGTANYPACFLYTYYIMYYLTSGGNTY